MDSVRGGSQDAAWELVSTYGSFVERFIRRTLSRGLRSKYDTNDFIQAVWASFFRDRKRFDAFDDSDHLIGFLVGIARNKVLQESRKRYDTVKSDVRREVPLSAAGESDACGLKDRGASPSQWAIARERWASIMRDQTPQHRQVVQLRIAGATFEEIGCELGMSERTARRVIDRLVMEMER